MPSFSSDHKVNHKAEEMFRLVADVERYPEFVPLCQDLHVRGRKELDGGRTVLVADMTVAYKLFKETFTSRVELRPQDPVINDHLGDAYWMVGRKLEARFQWKRSLSLDPDKDLIPKIKAKLESGLEPS